MRLGLPEILIIGLVIVVLFGVTKLRGGKETPPPAPKRQEQVIRISKPKQVKHPNLQLFGLITFIAGVVMIAISLGFIQTDLLTLGGIGIIVLGLVIIILSRRR